MPSSKKLGIQGPRPNPLKLTKDPYKSKKSAPPTVYYEHTPKIIHTSPQEFRGVVQQLTGRSATPDSSKDLNFNSNIDELRTAAGGGELDDSMLLLTLGRHQNAEKGISVSPSFVFNSPGVVRSSDHQEL